MVMFTLLHLFIKQHHSCPVWPQPSSPHSEIRGLGLTVEMLQQERARKEKRDLFFILCFVFMQDLQELGLQDYQQAACVSWRLGRGIKKGPSRSQGCSCVSKHPGVAKEGLVVCFWGARQCTRTLTPRVCLGGTSQSSCGQRGNQGHFWAYTARGWTPSRRTAGHSCRLCPHPS